MCAKRKITLSFSPRTRDLRDEGKGMISPSSLLHFSPSLLFCIRLGFARDKQLTDSQCRRRWRACTQMRSLSRQIFFFFFSEAAAICCSRNNLVPSLCQFQTFREHEIVIDVKRFHPTCHGLWLVFLRETSRQNRPLRVSTHTQDMRAQRSVRESSGHMRENQSAAPESD